MDPQYPDGLSITNYNPALVSTTEAVPVTESSTMGGYCGRSPMESQHLSKSGPLALTQHSKQRVRSQSSMAAVQYRHGSPHRSVWSSSTATSPVDGEFDNYSYHDSPVCSPIQPAYSPRIWAAPKQITYATPMGIARHCQQQTNATRGPFLTQQEDIHGSTNHCSGRFQSFDSSHSMVYHTPSPGLTPTTPPTITSQSSVSPNSPSLGNDIPNSGFSMLKIEHSQDGVDHNNAMDSLPEPSGSSSPKDSPGRRTAPDSQGQEPYAQLIYRAFMSRPRHSMTLQELYQWFRENTDKPSRSGRGWQNSIRHNLSMNAAFTKSRRLLPDPNSSTGILHEWFLEPWAVQHGVQSTTRYRKGGNPTRSARRAGSSSKAEQRDYRTQGRGLGRCCVEHSQCSRGDNRRRKPRSTASCRNSHGSNPAILPPTQTLPSQGSAYTNSGTWYSNCQPPVQLVRDQGEQLATASHNRRAITVKCEEPEPYTAVSTPQSGPQTPQTPQSVGLPIPDPAAGTTSSSNDGVAAPGAYHLGAPDDLAGYSLVDVLSVCTGGHLFDPDDAVYGWSEDAAH